MAPQNAVFVRTRTNTSGMSVYCLRPEIGTFTLCPILSYMYNQYLSSYSYTP